MLSWSVLGEALVRFGLRATDRRALPLDVEHAWLLALAPQDLARLADAARRSWWNGGPLGRASDWQRVRLERDPVRGALAALNPDGFVREAGVRGLAWQDEPLATRVLAVATTDHVAEVRQAAWAALSARTGPEHAREALPVLVAVSRRSRAPLEAYADLLDADLLADLVQGLDKDTRVWIYERLELGTDVARLEGWLAAERDQRARALLSRALVQQAPERAGWLLASSRADDRLAALWYLPSAAVSVAVVEEHLLGRSAGLREAARWRYRRAGGDPAAFYAAVLETVADDAPVLPRLLAGMREVGVPLSAELAEHLVADPRPGVRLEGMQGWPGPGPDTGLLLRLVLDDSPRVARWAAQWVGARASYADLEPAARSASPATRRIALVARRRRGDWSRIRADLEALGDPELADDAAADLRNWLVSTSSGVYARVDDEDRAEILRLLDQERAAEPVARMVRFILR